jgi:hypothetical protein
MTFVGKLFVLVNLAISLMMAVAAFGLYATGLDYDSETRSKGQAQPPAKFTALRKDIEATLSTWNAVEGSWRTNRKSLLERQDQRRADHQWYVTQLEFARSKATAADPVKVVVLDKHLPVPDPANFNRPTMRPSDPPLESLAAYVAQWEVAHKDNLGVQERLQAQIKEDIRLTHQLTGTTEAMDDRSKEEKVPVRVWKLGYRQVLVDERDKREGVEAEYNSVRPLFINVAVELELVRTRYNAMQERIKELKTYLRKRHKVDVAMGRR